MTAVRFELPETEDAELSSGVPVQVLDEDMAVVATGAAGETVELPPGLYAARATLPNGARAECGFRVSGQAPITPIRLRQTTAPAPPPDPGRPDSLVQRLRHFELSDVGFRFPRRRSASPPEQTPPPGQLKVRVRSGDPFGRLVNHGSSVLLGVGQSLTLAGQKSQVFLQVRPPLWMLVAPVRPATAACPPGEIRVEIRGQGGAVFPHFHFDDPELELLLQYLGANASAAAVRVAERQGSPLEAGRSSSAEQSFASVVRAYALLKRQPLERMTWVRDLKDSFEWMPDAHILYGEWLARRGDHQAAKDAFAIGLAHGTPYFSSGVSFVMSRFQQYREAASSPPAKVSAFERLGTRLRDLALRTDFQRPITTFKPLSS